MYPFDDKDLLIKLLENFYENSEGELHWSWREEYNIDPKLNKELKDFISYHQVKSL